MPLGRCRSVLSAKTGPFKEAPQRAETALDQEAADPAQIAQ
jgi:hypothetical protein